MDGCYALPHQNQGPSEHRDELACPGLQHEADDQRAGRGNLDEGDERIGAFSVRRYVWRRLFTRPREIAAAFAGLSIINNVALK